MAGPLVLVVGDKFVEFTAGKDVLTLSQLRGLMQLSTDLIPGRLVLVPGQGLGDEDIDAILDLAESMPHRERFDLSHWRRTSRRAVRALSHKHHQRNTMISEPRQTAADQFELDVLIDDDCELMGDHQTGQHLQGMLLVEAARQASLAVSEAFFLPKNDDAFYFVFDALQADFKRFIFPLELKMRCVIREKDLEAANRRFVLDFFLKQAGQDVASVMVSFTIVKNRSIGRIEASLARETLSSHLGAVSAMTPPEDAHAGEPNVWAAE